MGRRVAGPLPRRRGEPRSTSMPFKVASVLIPMIVVGVGVTTQIGLVGGMLNRFTGADRVRTSALIAGARGDGTAAGAGAGAAAGAARVAGSGSADPGSSAAGASTSTPGASSPVQVITAGGVTAQLRAPAARRGPSGSVRVGTTRTGSAPAPGTSRSSAGGRTSSTGGGSTASSAPTSGAPTTSTSTSGAATTTTTTTGKQTTTAASDSASEVVRLTNEERASAGCPALTVDSRLARAAQAHSDDMADNDYFDHNSQDGTSPFERIQAAGYSYRMAAENIAAGQPTAQAVVDAWMNSAGHRANILNCSLTQIGVGVASGGGYGIYWTQDFGTPR